MIFSSSYSHLEFAITGNGIGKGLLSKVAEVRMCFFDGSPIVAFCFVLFPAVLTTVTHHVQVAKKKQCARLQLSVLDWNTAARDFYLSKGAQDLTVSEGWHAIRFTDQSLENLANEAPKN